MKNNVKLDIIKNDLIRINDISINIQMVEEYILSLADENGYINQNELDKTINFFKMNNLLNEDIEQLMYNYLQYHGIQIKNNVSDELTSKRG